MLNKELTTIYRILVLKHDLYDTGRFFKSLRLYVIPKGNALTIRIEGIDYGLYLQDKLINDFLQDSRFHTELNNILVDSINEEDVLALKNITVYRRLVILYNQHTVISVNL